MTFMQEKVLQKIDSANFGPGGDDDEQYRNDFFDGKTASSSTASGMPAEA